MGTLLSLGVVATGALYTYFIYQYVLSKKVSIYRSMSACLYGGTIALWLSHSGHLTKPHSFQELLALVGVIFLMVIVAWILAIAAANLKKN